MELIFFFFRLVSWYYICLFMTLLFSFSGLQSFEIMGIAAVGNNLITYVINEMHFSLSKSANIVTNFIGTVFLLALVGGYLSDSYLGSFWTMLIFGFVELSVRAQPATFPSSSFHLFLFFFCLFCFVFSLPPLLILSLFKQENCVCAYEHMNKHPSVIK